MNANLASYRATRIAGPLNVQVRDDAMALDGERPAQVPALQGTLRLQWAERERLAGALSSFRPKGSGIGAHIGYSPYCVPRVIDGIKCVIVNEALKDIEPMAWDFVMNFARDNGLQVAEACLLPDLPLKK